MDRIKLNQQNRTDPSSISLFHFGVCVCINITIIAFLRHTLTGLCDGSVSEVKQKMRRKKIKWNKNADEFICNYECTMCFFVVVSQHRSAKALNRWLFFLLLFRFLIRVKPQFRCVNANFIATLCISIALCCFLFIFCLLAALSQLFRDYGL